MFIYVCLILLIIIFFHFLSRGEKKIQYGMQSITENGEIVKSKGEKFIADYFVKNNISYEYEREARTKGIFGKHISYPDFYLPDFDVFVEYWGLIDADNNKIRKKYEKKMRWKMAQYHNNDIKFISIYPRNMDNFDWIFRKKFKDVTGFDFPA